MTHTAYPQFVCVWKSGTTANCCTAEGDREDIIVRFSFMRCGAMAQNSCLVKTLQNLWRLSCDEVNKVTKTTTA